MLDITELSAYDYVIRRQKEIRITKENSVQNIIPIEEIKENGIIKLKNETYIKILKIIPINYELKSELEKKTILNSYKSFLKTCNFNLQILIQSKKEDLTSHLQKISYLNIQNEKMDLYRQNYINYLKKVSSENKSSNKEFYLILKVPIENDRDENENMFKIAENKLLENFNKVKDTLSRTGTIIKQIDSYKDIEILLKEMYPIK